MAGARTLAVPDSAFAWATFGVTSSGASYGTNIDFDVLKPTPVFTYYCSPTGSAVATPTDNDPLTPITPRRFVTLANANGGIVEAKIASGVYYGNIGFDGNNLTCAGVILSLWAGQQATAPGYPVFVKRSTNVIAPWTAVAGNVYSTPNTVANLGVFDLLYRDANGLVPRLTEVGSLVACQALPGSFFNDNAVLGVMNVHAQDDRSLIGDASMLVPTAGSVFVRTPIIDAVTWIDGIYFFGPVTFTMATAAKLLSVYNRNTGFFGGTNGLGCTGTILCYSLSPRVGGNRQDGLNYHGNAQGQVHALEYDVRSSRNGFDGGTINNASTIHETCSIIRVASQYAGSEGRPINDINSSTAWMVGCSVAASVNTDASSVTVQAGLSGGTAALMWLDTCTVANSTTATLYADTGCAIHTFGIDTSGMTLAGAGTIDTYTRTYA